MAQINAQRQARGQDPYVDRRMQEDEAYRQAYTTAGESYAQSRNRGAQINAKRQNEQEARNKAFAERSSAAKTGMQQGEQERQDLGRMNVDFLKMKQSGGDMSWEDFKKMWSAPKVSTPPVERDMRGSAYA